VQVKLCIKVDLMHISLTVTTKLLVIGGVSEPQKGNLPDEVIDMTGETECEDIYSFPMKSVTGTLAANLGEKIIACDVDNAQCAYDLKYQHLKCI